LRPELFGYERGAFTKWLSQLKRGLFEMAEGGTIYLDEIGEMPLHLQAKLLSVIETKKLAQTGRSDFEGPRNSYCSVYKH